MQIVGNGGEGDSTDVETYRFKDTMIRVKDIEKSLEFYRSVLGLNLFHTVEMPEHNSNVYYLGYRHGSQEVSEAQLLEREGVS